MTGHDCDNCGKELRDRDFYGTGSWSYTCPKCGFRYIHDSTLTAEEQVERFNSKEEE